MAGVNNAKDYYTLMGFGTQNEDGSPHVYDALLQGGIVSVYYLGTLVGALFGGWFGDKQGRIRAIAMGSVWAILGASLQGSAQNHQWMICARFINGIGTGELLIFGSVIAPTDGGLQVFSMQSFLSTPQRPQSIHRADNLLQLNSLSIYSVSLWHIGSNTQVSILSYCFQRANAM